MPKIDKLYQKPSRGGSSKIDRDDQLLQKIRKRHTSGTTYWLQNRESAEEDLLFLSGEQWPAGVRNEREAEGRPCLVNNVLPTFVDQVLGDQRQNRPQIKISPVSMVQVPAEGGSKELTITNQAGTHDYSLAEVMSALVRNIEYQSDAETAYDFGFQAAVESGMGYLRVRADYLADDTFEQDIKIEHIDNQFSVMFDPNAKEFDRSDSMWCMVEDMMEKETFKDLYPDALCEAPDDVGQGQMSAWFGENTVKVCEYYEREPIIKEIALLSDGRTMAMDEIEKVVDELFDMGIRIVRTRKVKTFKTTWRKVTGMDVLEGPVEIPCSTIPVVPIWGKVLTIKTTKIYRSIIRHSKDAQRQANYWDSAATESVALAPKAPYIADVEQVEGFEDDWRTANTRNHSVLFYNKMHPNDTGPRRVDPARVPSAEIAQSMNSTEKIKATLGMYDASLGNAGNETSGKAIIARQRQGDRGSYAFIDNLSKAIRRVGQLLVEMIPKIYDTERVIRLKFEDGTEDFVQINQMIQDRQTGEFVKIYDLGVAKYDVVVTTGPSYATQRSEAAESMIQFAQAVPNAAAAMSDLIAGTMDWPNADILAKRLRKTIPPALLTGEEREQLQDDMPEQQGPTPEQQVQMAELETRQAEAQAERVKAESDIEIARLKLQEAQQKAAANAVDMRLQIRETVAEAIAEFMQSQRQRVA